MQQPYILAGVIPGQSTTVVAQAAALAATLGATLICAYADPSRYPVTESPDGTVTSAPVDPDFIDDAEPSFPSRLATSLESLFASLEVPGKHLPWHPLLLAGDPAQALGHCAQTLQAAMIVVGTHGDTHTALREIMHHSVAFQLARKQSCPVLVIPTHHGSATQVRL